MIVPEVERAQVREVRACGQRFGRVVAQPAVRQAQRREFGEAAGVASLDIDGDLQLGAELADEACDDLGGQLGEVALRSFGVEFRDGVEATQSCVDDCWGRAGCPARWIERSRSMLTKMDKAGSCNVQAN